MKKPTLDETIAACERILRLPDDEHIVRIMKPMARTLLASARRRRDSRASGAKFATYKFDSDDAQQAWERN